MSDGWETEFRHRIRSFQAKRPTREGEVAVSLKVRVESGCFHREHSPQGYAIIDKRLASLASGSADFEFVEHESGPELLVLLDLTAAGVALAAAVIDLVVAIIGARREGIHRGDHPSDPIELVVRRVDSSDTYREERVLRISTDESVDPAQIEALVRAALQRVAADNPDASK